MKAYILLDRSGSMQTRWAETIGALNAYVAGLAGEKATKKTEVTVAAFDNQDPFLVLRSGVKASDWKPISEDEIRPRGMTPLYDAIGKLVSTVRQDSPKKATIVVITDGAENGSREFKKDAAKSMLDELRAKQFDVVFIGADFDAFAQGAGLGNAFGSTIVMKGGNYGAAMNVLATRSMAYASGGAVASFSDADRKLAAGAKA
ncbi:vWA domain-containing protein [Mesorhizobium sp. DCY119]|uniref:vWA domain-containing protein n=1 Tax=Mesorhizobium sp. DCY119 TaxID=2108445 RepID=UPI0013C4ABE6|nr:vWA domain-containing protein [Mesorhizobium sp. DCY119]